MRYSILIYAALQFALTSRAGAQEWNPPFNVDESSTMFAFPAMPAFAEFDSALVIIKARFHESEPRIDRFEILKVQLMAGDSLAYSYLNENALGSFHDDPTPQEEYPEVARLLYNYIEKKMPSVKLTATDYSEEEYRSRPVALPIRFRRCRGCL